MKNLVLDPQNIKNLCNIRGKGIHETWMILIKMRKKFTSPERRLWKGNFRSDNRKKVSIKKSIVIKEIIQNITTIDTGNLNEVNSKRLRGG